MHEAEEEEPGFVGGRVEDEAEAARADGAEAPQQLQDGSVSSEQKSLGIGFLN